MATQDMNRGAIPANKATEILAGAAEISAFMQLVPQVSLPGNGQEIKVLLGDPTAAWVAETAPKPRNNPTLGTKVLKPSKLAFIETFSMEFRRDYESVFNQLIARAPSALAKAFDNTIAGGVAAPDSNFDQLSGATAVNIATGTYGALVGADGAIATAGGATSGIAGSPALRSLLLGATDTTGRPLFIDNAMVGQQPTVIGLPSAYGRGVANGTTIGFIGDFTLARWGTTGGIEVTFTDQASIVLADDSVINLFQDNMFAVRVEVSIGFIVADNKYFRKLTNA